MPKKAASRDHGVIDQASVRVVGMDPENVRPVIRETEDMRYPLQSTSLTEPPRVRLGIGKTPVGILSNGLGANWSPPGQGEEAFPEDTDEAGWAHLFRQMTFAGIKWVRYWVGPGLVEKGKVVADHRFLQRLDRLQAWAAATEATIMFEFAVVPEEFQFGGVYDAPRDNQEYVDHYLLPLLRHIWHERQCNRLRQICLYNEPFNPDVNPFIYYPPPPHDALEYYLDLHEKLRLALDRAKVPVGLIGPNTANMFQRLIELYEDRGLAPRMQKAFAELDVHMWRLRFDYYPPTRRWPGYTITEGIERYLKPTLAAAARMGKTLSLTEVGSMYFNDFPSTARNTRHDAFLVMAEEIIRAVNAGVTGAMVWAFTNSGRIDGQWGWIGNRAKKFAPVPNLLNGFATLMRFQQVGAQIRPCTVALADFSSFISAGALLVPGQGETIWLVNDHPVENIRVEIGLPPDRSRKTWAVYRKDFDPEMKCLEPLPDRDGLELNLPGMSLTTLTTLPQAD